VTGFCLFVCACSAGTKKIDTANYVPVEVNTNSIPDEPRKLVRIIAHPADGKSFEADFFLRKAFLSAATYSRDTYYSHLAKDVCFEGNTDSVNGQMYYSLDLCFTINENKSVGDKSPINLGVYHPGSEEDIGRVSGFGIKIRQGDNKEIFTNLDQHPYGTVEITRSEDRKIGGKINLSFTNASVSGEFECRMSR
jgi:hypothetical protein